MARILIFAACIFLPITMQAQQREIDSLLRLMNTSPTNDSLRLAYLNDLAYHFSTTNPDSGLLMAKKALPLSIELDDISAQASAHSNRGINHWAKGEDSLALAAYEQALHLHVNAKNENGQARAFNNMALIYYNLNQYPKAIDYHEKALAIFEAHDHKVGILNSYNNMGVIFLAMDDYPRALQAFFDALRIADDESEASVNALINIGLVYKHQGKYGDALRHYRQALTFYDSIGNRQGSANVLGNIGVVYSNMGLPDTAIVYFERALSINNTIGNQRRIAGDLANIGVAYKHAGNTNQAINYLKQAISEYEQTQDKANLSLALNELANVLLLVPDVSTTHEAKQLLQRALLLAQETGSLENESVSWLGLSRIYERENKSGEALHAYKQHVRLRDSVYNAEKEKELVSQSLQFDFDKKEALLKSTLENEKALATAEIKRQRLIKSVFAYGGALFVIIAATAYLLYKKRRDADERRREAEFKTLVAETEMKALRAQMNPHFIFNSLNAISSFITKEDLRKADEYLTKFAAVMRMILENSEHKEISLADDLKALELYMQLEAARVRNPFTYEIRIDETLDPDNILVPPLIIQPFVENSIWHGLAGKDGPGKIVISIQHEGDRIRCSVEDDGVGLHRPTTGVPNTHTKARQSMGIRITESRIAIANKGMPLQNNIRFIPLGEGLRVEVDLPLALNY